MKTLRRTLALLLAVLLMVSMTSSAFAEDTTGDYEATNPYVLNHNVSGDGYDGPDLQYFSPYVSDYTYDNEPSYIQSNVFSLYNTINNEVIPAYCTDIKVGALPEHSYRRLNLEDSTYAANTAGLLRAIMHSGFYLVPDSAETMDDHAVRVAAKLQQLGAAAGVPDLTIGEAISGTQTAIWRAAHGSRLEFTDFVRTIYTTKLPSLTKYYDLCNAERENGYIDFTVSTYGKVTVEEECDARINARIKAVYDYLLSLEPIAPTAKAVSAASFVNVNEATPSENADGTYDVTVIVTVDVDKAASDTLTLSAILDNTRYASAPLTNGTQTTALTIKNVPADMAFNNVTVSIDGKQTVSEVFLYEAEGGREAAQSMIGMEESQLPVHAEVIATTDRVLHFYKTAPVATGTGTYTYYPLEGITFDIYFIATLDDYLSGSAELPDPETYEYPELADHIVITDQNGRATVNFTQHGMPDGVYLIVEREHAAIKKPVDPFFVFIPTTNADGTGYDYEVTVQPKNDIKGSVRIEKDVISIGNDQATTDSYVSHTWIIGATIPEDIADGKSYVISDTLDSRLDYVGNMKVNVETTDGQTMITTLTADTDYILTLTDVDSLVENTPSDSFTIELTRTGMRKIANSIGDNSFSDYMLRVYFDAQINANAKMGAEIPNQSTLKYTNSVNFDFNVESDKPVVYTGGANLLKVDADNHTIVLPGAVFEVYRTATAEEVTAGGNDITNIAGVSAPVVKVSFFDDAAMTGEKVTAVTSDKNGKLAIYGLAYGEYYLLETKSPDGYNLLGNAVKLTIDSTSHTEEKIVIVENVAGAVLPSTGGVGTTVYITIGTALICASILFFCMNKRKTY